MSKNVLPPLMVVCGSNHFQCRRAVQATLKLAREAGYAVEQADLASLADNLSGLMTMFGENPKLLYWLKASGKIDADLVTTQQAAGSEAPRLLLWHEGEPDARTTFAKTLDKLPKGTVKKYDAPSDFKAEAEAAVFLSAEMKAHGYPVSVELAQAIVERAGFDYGVLAFEALKLKLLAEAEGTTEVTPALVRQSLSALGDTTSLQFIDALRTRNPKRISQVLSRIRKSNPSGSGAVKELVGRTLSTLTLALQAADLHERGKDPKEAAVIVGQNPWYYENKVLPFVPAWGRQRLRDLVVHFCKSDRAVVQGTIDPWIAFEVGILRIVSL